jgi:hypothetical protein
MVKSQATAPVLRTAHSTCNWPSDKTTSKRTAKAAATRRGCVRHPSGAATAGNALPGLRTIGTPGQVARKAMFGQRPALAELRKAQRNATPDGGLAVETAFGLR